LIGDRYFLASCAPRIAEETMRAHISLSKHRCLHDLLVISLGKIRQSDQKYFQIAAERDIRGAAPARGETPRWRLLVVRLLLDCNDGYGGSGSGLFTEDGRLIAMHSASLDMNAKRPFDIETHYGSALLFEGELLEAIKSDVEKTPWKRGLLARRKGAKPGDEGVDVLLRHFRKMRPRKIGHRWRQRSAFLADSTRYRALELLIRPCAYSLRWMGGDVGGDRDAGGGAKNFASGSETASRIRSAFGLASMAAHASRQGGEI
jgi:hypothetical protein